MKFTNSDWIRENGYHDCLFNFRNLPLGLVDCLIPDWQKGPSEFDRRITPEPEGLKYIHMSPRISYHILRRAQSLLPGMDGDKIVTCSLMVHPAVEELLYKTGISQDERVETFYLPFVNAFTGEEMPFKSVKLMYVCALAGAYGSYFQYNDWYVAVQLWDHHVDCNIHVVKGD